MSKEIELLTEIRDLLQVMAEPALEKRDAKLRTSLRKLVGGSEKKAKAVLLMDGSRSRAQIVQQSGIDQGDLSRLVKALGTDQLVSADEKQPRLLLKIPPNFFEGGNGDE